MNQYDRPVADLVHIEGVALTPLTYQGQRVVTFRQIDEAHQRPDGTARRNFTANRRHLIEGEDYWDVCGDEIRTRNLIPDLSPKARRVILLNESGYLMLAKSLTDDLAWRVQRALVQHYFSPLSRPVEQLDEEARVDWFTEVVTDPVRAVKVIHRLGCDLEQARTQIMELTPKAEFYDAVSGSIGSMTVKDAAQACGTGERRFFKWLRAHGYLQQGNRPYQRWIDRGYFETRLHTFNLDRGTITRTQPLVTGKGLARFQREMGCGHSLAFELDANLEVQS